MGSPRPAWPRPPPSPSPEGTWGGPRPLTVPVLKDDAHAAVAARLLAAVHEPQGLHLGVHEGALLHTAGRTAVSGGRSAGPPAGGGARGGCSPDFSQQGAGVQRGLHVGKGLQVGLLTHAHVHQLLGLGLGGLLGAHFDKVIQGLQFAQRLPLAGRAGRWQWRWRRVEARRGRLLASPPPLPGGSKGVDPLRQRQGRGLTCFMSTFMWWVLPRQ